MEFDVLGLGELLIDFTPAGQSSAGNPQFEQNPGGAPANMLVALAIVHLGGEGNRSFSFYRKPGADTLLEPRDVDPDLIRRCRVFHFGSLSMTDEPSRSATMHAVRSARALGKIISYDPNWRPPLWESERAALQGMRWGLDYTDVLKVSEEELGFLTGEKDMERAAEKLFGMGIKIVLATLGPGGCYFRCGAGAMLVPAFPTDAVDTTGAGDAFLGGFLYRLCRAQKQPGELSLAELAEMVRFSNAVGALCAAGKGAIPSMPAREDVELKLRCQW